MLVIAGKSREELKAEARKQWETMSVAEHVQVYMSQGMDKKEAMKAAAKDRGVSKGIYTRSLKGKRKQLPDSVLSDDCTYCLEKIRLDSIYVSRFFIKNCAVAS